MEILIWVGFIIFVLALLALDLFFLNRGSHTISAAKALKWTGFFVSIALSFALVVYFIYEHKFLGIGLNVPKHGGGVADVSGLDAVSLYLQGYMLEYALSMDNIFVIALIFRFFAVPAQHQHRVLFWGILGALVLRGVMIGVGAALVREFQWIMYPLGAFLLITGIKLLFSSDDDEFKPGESIAVKITRKFIPISDGYDGRKFFTRLADGSRAATTLFLALAVVEFTDVIFAVDSIPAIFGLTMDPFIVFTSNVFAILGLRSLYFALAAMLGRFRFLKYSLSIVLAFVGVKMLLPLIHLHVHPLVSLAVIAISLGVGVFLSLAIPPKEEPESSPAAAPREPTDTSVVPSANDERTHA